MNINPKDINEVRQRLVSAREELIVLNNNINELKMQKKDINRKMLNRRSQLKHTIFSIYLALHSRFGVFG